MSYSRFLEHATKIEKKIHDSTGNWLEVHYQQDRALKLFLEAVREGGLSYNETHHLADVIHRINTTANDIQPPDDHFLGERFA